MKTHKEVRLANLVQRRENVTKQHEDEIQVLERTEDEAAKTRTQENIAALRTEAESLDAEIADLTSDIERDRAAAERAKNVRRTLANPADGVEVDEDGIAYRDFYSYARDVVLTRTGREVAAIAAQFSRADREAAAERLSLLERTPANTLTSNVGGLNPPQHIAQIFQVINKSRPLVESAGRTTLERGTLTYPKVSQRPIVAIQATEKTEAGNQGMVVDLETAQASTYLGGGDLSWQQLNWSTPDALTLWFDLAAADYALKTEEDAAQALTDSAFAHIVGSPLGSTPDFPTFMTAVAAGMAAVYAASKRQADTIYMAEDRFSYMLGLTSTPTAQFASVSDGKIGPLTVVRTRGLASGEIVVGDSTGLLVAETAGAPVELRVVEPAIGGLEVGIIGAFEAVVVDDGAFALITTAS